MYNAQAGGNPLPVEDLVKRLEKRGAEVLAKDTKEDDYKNALEEPCDFILIAGGDGTIEKIAKKIIHRNVPVALLPCGNANNIAESLDVDTALSAIVNSWDKRDFRKFTVGSVAVDGERQEFLESVGWGLFANVLKEVKANKKDKKKQPAGNGDKVKSGLEKLTLAVQELQPEYFQVILDGVDHSGSYLWVEVMNTQSIGPQLQLAPEVRHGDEFLDVVLIKEDEKARLEDFLKQSGDNYNNLFHPVKARKVGVRSSQPLHIDDEIFKGKGPSDQWAEITLLPEFFLIINA